MWKTLACTLFIEVVHIELQTSYQFWRRYAGADCACKKDHMWRRFQRRQLFFMTGTFGLAFSEKISLVLCVGDFQSGDILQALVWKHYLVKRRTWLLTLMEIISPMMIVGILVRRLSPDLTFLHDMSAWTSDSLLRTVAWDCSLRTAVELQ